ncbi:hypothetical protein M413DRAFT_410826 [Hebeloma cylindrosporum]|uniref:Uncharacterized protein n=1 Tax=Hebeloma cylindrosporum TaxID=76867 RepID=A0A0C3CAM5_HEBCY|nr:hypothetical protein M413DRAFT_410826 [Hebeloma cylindrosporum h7]
MTPCPERTWHILGMAASSLTEIHIDHTDEVVGLPENFNLGSVHNLKVFKYSCRSSNQDGYHNIKESTPSILFHLFHVPKPMENLKTIGIQFNLEENSLDDIVLGKFTDHHGWTLLDIDLSKTSHFPSLLQFGIDIAITLPYPVKQYASRNCIKKSNDDLKSSFPHVLATESISFCPTTTLLVDWDSYSDPMEV